MKYTYQTQGVCARRIHLDISENEIIQDVRFEGGCNGNTQGLQALVIGRGAREVQQALKGIRCEKKTTSCPDQLSRAIGDALENRPLT